MYLLAVRHQPHYEEYLDDYIYGIRRHCFISSTGTPYELARIYGVKCHRCSDREVHLELGRDSDEYSVFGSRDQEIMTTAFQDFVKHRMEPTAIDGAMPDFLRQFNLRCRLCHELEQLEIAEEAFPPPMGASLLDEVVEYPTQETSSQTPKEMRLWQVKICID